MNAQSQRKWLFCVASAPCYGGGHIMRTLQLANFMRKKSEVDFLLDTEVVHWGDYLKKYGHTVYNDVSQVNEKYDGIWVDHYQPDYEKIKSLGIPMAGIVDSADQKIDLDFCVSYTPHQRATICGMQYALIDPSYSSLRVNVESRNHYTLCFGQSDTKGATVKILKYLENSKNILNINVVCGANNKRKSEILDITSNSRHNFNLYHAPKGLKGVFENTGVFVTSGGVSVLEACAAGIPCLVIATADNQLNQIRALAQKNAALFCGEIENISQHDVFSCFFELESDEAKNNISKIARKLIDGKGANRVCESLLEWNENFKGIQKNV